VTPATLTRPGISDLIPGFEAESELERRIVTDPALLRGLAWKVNHPGHPESRVGLHVASILARITAAGRRRADLRFIALVHDSFKHEVDPAAGYSLDNDHAVLAARFARRYTSDRRILDAIELHDEAYWIWHQSSPGVAALLARVADAPLLVDFIQLDASTEGKDPNFLWWLRQQPSVRRMRENLVPHSVPDAAHLTCGEPQKLDRIWLT
jgi:hypothetical protein